MFSYLMDAICAHNAFLGMNRTWTPQDLVVHIYCKFLSECSHKGVMEKMLNHFLIPLYKFIFEEERPCVLHGVMEVVSEISNYFASPNATFLRLFGKQISLHLLPKYVTDKLFMQEFAYHLSIGLSTTLHKKKKAPWPTFSYANHIVQDQESESRK